MRQHDVSAMDLRNPARQREAESRGGIGRASRSRSISPVEALEDVRLVFGWYSWTGIGYGYGISARLFEQLDADGARGRGVPDGVVE